MSIFEFSTWAVIALSLQCLLGYKFTTHFSYLPLIKKMSLTISFAIMAIAELFYFETTAFPTFFYILICYVLFPYIVLFLITFYVFKTEKTDAENRPSIALFLYKFKIRNYFLSKGASNIHFFKNDGVNVYFEKYSARFDRLNEYELEHFKNNLKNNTMEHVEMHKFVILNVKDDYMSLSSDDLMFLDVPLDKITRRHFDMLSMLHI